MADISDVQTELVSIIAGIVYPNGTGAASIIAPVDLKIYAGWPNPQQLDQDLAPTGTNSPPNGPAAFNHVSVFPLPVERNVTRYRRRQQAGALAPATYTLAVAGQSVTVGGAPPASYYPQNIAVFANAVPYVYQTQAGDTPATVAAGLQALIVVGVPGTTVSGAIVTLPATARIGALRVGTMAPTSTEIRRQERDVQITIWSDSPANRDALAKAIDPALGALTFITLADGSRGRLIYKGSPVNDFSQKQAIYRRDFRYSVEYATLQTGVATEIVAVRGGVNWQDVGLLGAGFVTFEGSGGPITFGNYATTFSK